MKIPKVKKTVKKSFSKGALLKGEKGNDSRNRA